MNEKILTAGDRIFLCGKLSDKRHTADLISFIGKRNSNKEATKRSMIIKTVWQQRTLI